MTMQKTLSLLGLCLAASAVQASDLYIALSDKTVSLDYVGATQNGTLQMNMGAFTTATTATWLRWAFKCLKA